MIFCDKADFVNKTSNKIYYAKILINSELPEDSLSIGKQFFRIVTNTNWIDFCSNINPNREHIVGSIRWPSSVLIEFCGYLITIYYPKKRDVTPEERSIVIDRANISLDDTISFILTFPGEVNEINGYWYDNINDKIVETNVKGKIKYQLLISEDIHD